MSALVAQGTGAVSGRFAAVIFDFEGTLVDFQWRLAEAEAELRAACAALGHGSAGNYAELWNAAAARAPDRLVELRRALGPIYERWDADALGRWSPRAGAAALLGGLHAAGIGAALVSNIGRRALATALERFGFAAWLRPVISRDEVTFMKPHAEGILRALAGLSIPASAALFVGDSRTDVRAARAAGMAVALVRGGEGDEADYAACPPDFLLTGLEEVAALLSRPAAAGRGEP